jgi:predicted outer membrane lipoprotein
VTGALAAAAAVLLGFSGLAKLRSPGIAATMIGRLAPAVRRRRRALVLGVRMGGAVEIGVAAGFLAVGGAFAASLLAAAYAVFTAVAIRLMTDGRRTSCGCFGAADSPVGTAHVVLDAGCLAVATSTALRPVGAAGGVLAHPALVAATGVAQVLLLAWLGYLSITSLPALAALRHFEEG